MSDNYAIDKQMERLQQEVAELRNGQIVAAVNHAELDGIVRELSGRLAALERPAAATADPVLPTNGRDEEWHRGLADSIIKTYPKRSAGTPAQPAPAEGIDVEAFHSVIVGAVWNFVPGEEERANEAADSVVESLIKKGYPVIERNAPIDTLADPDGYIRAEIVPILRRANDDMGPDEAWRLATNVLDAIRAMLGGAR